MRADIIKYLTKEFCPECGVGYVFDGKDHFCPRCGLIKYNALEFNYTGLIPHKKE